MVLAIIVIFQIRTVERSLSEKYVEIEYTEFKLW